MVISNHLLDHMDWNDRVTLWIAVFVSWYHIVKGSSVDVSTYGSTCHLDLDQGVSLL